MTSGKYRSEEDISQIVFNFGYELLDKYKNKWNKWKVIVKNKDGYKLDFTLQNLIKEKYSIVNKHNPYSLENISLWLKLNNKNFKLCDDNVYINQRKRLKFYCLDCDDYFFMCWNYIYRGENCSVCRGMQTGEKHSLAYLRPDWLIQWNYEKNKIFSDNITIGSDKKIYWICEKCGYGKNGEWLTSPHNRLRDNTGCPNCIFWKGEYRIKECLENIRYFFQHRFSDCKDIRSLPFDFYIPNSNICIEYHGEQHYRDVKFFNKGNGFKGLKKRDKIKEKYCKDNKIKLIVIPYWDYENIESILRKELI